MEKTIEPVEQTSVRPQLLDRIEGAIYCGISVITLDRAVKNKQVSCVRIGRRVLFRPSDLQDFISRNVVGAKK